MEMNQVKKIAVIGAGRMGCGIAHSWAQAGYNVSLVDLDEQILNQCFGILKSNLNFLVENGMIDAQKSQSILSLIRGTTKMEEALHDVDWVAESVPEVLDLKKDVFRRMDNVCPDETILTTNTSTLSISEIAAVTTRPDKVIGFHWVNPAHLVPLVEIIPSAKTSASTLATAKEAAVILGKIPMVCKEIPGFIVNRLQFALLGEAISLLEQGVASAEDIDNAARIIFGLRTPFWGPLRNNDIFGNKKTTLAAFEYLFKETKNEKFRPSDLLREKVNKGELGIISGKGWYDYTGESLDELAVKRDRNLIKMIKFMGELK